VVWLQEKTQLVHQISWSNISWPYYGILQTHNQIIFWKKKVEEHIGGYVAVLVSGKSRALKYIARVDDFHDEEEYEGVFLQKVNSKITPGEDTEEPVSSLMKKMVLFAPKDIVLKLPTPLAVGGSAGEATSYVFNSTSLHWTWRRPAACSLQANPLVFLWQPRSPTGILFHIFWKLT